MNKSKLVELKDSLQARILKIIVPSAILSLMFIVLGVYGLMEELANPNYILIIMVLSIPACIGVTMFKIQGAIKKAGLNCLSCKAIFEFEKMDNILETNVCTKCNKQAFDE